MYLHLFECVDRRRKRKTGKPVSDRQHGAHVSALVAARTWAAEAGIVFKWIASDHFSKDDRTVRLWRCNAYLDGEPIGYIDQCDFGFYEKPGDDNSEWCECELALALISEFRAADDESTETLLHVSTRQAVEGV